MELKARFKVIMSSEADAFLDTLRQDIKDKIVYNVDKVANGYMDKDLFKKLDGTDIWEFRTLYKGIQYRLLAFWDTDAETLVIATHGFVKKTQKTPSKEINKAEAIENCISTQKNSDMETIKFYTLDEVKDKHIGKVGTPHRDKYEAELQSFLIGEAIKKARKSQNMTQEELAQKIGVQRAQVSKIESGRNLTLSTVARVFRAMGMEASLSIAGFGSITL